MSVRSDVIIDWSLSPRIITVLAPSTQISIQDLHDTLAAEESKWTGMDEPRIVSTAGKEPLGGGVLVGLTMTLQNAKLAFEARPGPTTVQVNVGGGNLVAVDEFLANLDPIQPTAFTQVVRTSSSSATLVSQTQLEAASYNGAVSIKPSSPYSGTEFPTGSRAQPVNNIADAIAISELRGLSSWSLLESMTFTAADDLSDGYLITGDNQSTVVLTLDSAPNVTNCTFHRMQITGIIDGGNICRNSVFIGTTTFFSGSAYDCTFTGEIVLAGNNEVQFNDCWSGISGGDVMDYPTIDMGGASGNALSLRGYSGSIGIKNSSGTEWSTLDFESGRAVFENTVTAGTFTVRGICDVQDDSTGTAVIHDLTLSASVKELVKAHFNKMVTDPVANTVTVYDDDDVTPLRTAPLYEDAAGTQPYRGQGAERRERMT